MTKLIEGLVREIITHLANSRYEELESMTQCRRLKAAEISNAIADYGRTIVLPPNDAYRLMDVIEVKDAVPPRWSVVMPMWTKEEGRSDLSLELTVIQDGHSLRAELDDLHIL